MKAKIIGLFNVLIILLVVYFLINIVHLAWYISDPESIFGWYFFSELLRMLLAIGILLFCLSFVLIILYDFLKSLFKGSIDFKSLLKGIGLILFASFMIIFNHLWVNGFSFLVGAHYSEKYSYINKTDKLLKNNEVKEALEFAKEAYNKENSLSINRFFICSRLYSLTNYDRQEKLLSKFEATINFAYCLSELSHEKKRAELKFLESIKLLESSSLISDIEKKNRMIFPIMALSSISFNDGNFENSDQLLDELYELIGFANNDDIVYIIMNNLLIAERALRVGDINKCSNIIKESLILCNENEKLNESINYATLLLIASNLELYVGNFNAALEYLLEANPLVDEREDTELYRSFLTIKALYCTEAAKAGKGDERIINRSILERIFERSFDKLSIKEKLFEEAESCFQELKSFYEKNTGVDSFIYLKTIYGLAKHYINVGNYKKAKTEIEEAINILEPNKIHNENLWNRINLMYVLINSKEGEYELDKLSDIQKFHNKRLFDNLMVLTDYEKEAYLLEQEKIFDFINNIYLKEGSKDSKEKLLQNIINLKNLSLYSSVQLNKYLLKEGGINAAKYSALRDSIKQEEFNSEKDQYQKIESISIDIRSLLKELRKDGVIQDYIPREIHWEEIKGALKKNEILIEFASIETNDINDKDYYAFIINSESKTPILSHLFKSSDLEKLLNAPGVDEERIDEIFRERAPELYSLIFGPIQEYIPEDCVLYISKTGLIHSIPLGPLTFGKAWELRTLSSVRSLLDTVESNKPKNIALIGGVNYNANEKIDTLSRSDNSLKDSVRSLVNLEDYQDLFYTYEEVMKIDSLIDSSYPSIVSNKFIDTSATEKVLRSLSSRDIDIVHLATHGFYFGTTFQARRIIEFDEMNLISLSEMIRSGLLLNGANKVRPSSYENDGIITALEIFDMDYSNAELVVLSACETGLGEIKGNQGVFGLQRAFKAAGVKTLIVSLWRVPDKQTSELMVKFYKHYFSGESIHKSLHNAQSEMKTMYANPYYWAGFEVIE